MQRVTLSALLGSRLFRVHVILIRVDTCWLKLGVCGAFVRCVELLPGDLLLSGLIETCILMSHKTALSQAFLGFII